MPITYDELTKALPCDKLHDLFKSVGWVDESKPGHTDHFNAPHINSTLVISAWDGDHLVGSVRVLSDCIIRSIIYDVAVLPSYQGQGIGSQLVRRCIAHYPSSEWLVYTKETAGFYEKLGFKVSDGGDVYLTIPHNF